MKYNMSMKTLNHPPKGIHSKATAMIQPLDNNSHLCLTYLQNNEQDKTHLQSTHSIPSISIAVEGWLAHAAVRIRMENG